MVDPTAAGLIAIAAALAVGLTGIGAALGEQMIGSAAVGAMAEDEGFFGRGLVIFGLVVALILLFVTLPTI
jgi:V/A-type H+-transporting ATPase subunit K